ncbi:MAG: TonB-dependent receptor [Bacteroidota bacterium]
MLRKLLVAALAYGFPYLLMGQTVPKCTISGYVHEAGSRESLPGVSVFVSGKSIGTTTNTYGFYSLTLPVGDSITLAFSFLGYRREWRVLALTRNLALDMVLTPERTELGEVEIRGTQKVSETVQMSTVSIPITQIKQIPTLFGEKDVLKVLQLLPGVQKGSEGSSSLYVRGGGPDQNLIILDDATVYNAFHLFGFLSLFNGDALKSVELTKGGFPARFGGRLSSVVDMQMKDGNKEKFTGEGGIGLLSSRLTLEGPLKAKKATTARASYLISARRTYLDLITRLIAKAGYGFYDLNAKVNYNLGRRNRLYLSGYFGRDAFSATNDYGGRRSRGAFSWGNTTATLRWNHQFNDRLFANTSLIFSDYRFQVSSEEENNGSIYSLLYTSGIRDWSMKYDVDYLLSPSHTIKAGVLATDHRFTPSALVLKDTQLDTTGRQATVMDALESAVYLEDTYQPLPQLRINAGIRISQFSSQQKNYVNPEPRLALAYTLPNDWAIKASYATMYQYIHLLSNTGLGLPTDLWIPSTDKIAPQRSQQVALGVAKDISKHNLTLTIEGYYKKMDRTIGYKEGASFLILDDGPEEPGKISRVKWEDNITQGQGWSYGGEVLLQRKAGKFSGWLGYTLSWTQQQFEQVNFGKKFFARYDRRHDISLVGIYQLSKKITLAATWVYGSGNAITIPIAEYQAEAHNFGGGGDAKDHRVADYGNRNSFRMAPYHRLDLGIQFHKKKRWGERTWEINVYNAYNRSNPFYYSSGYKKNNSNEKVLYQTSLFPILPSVSYSFKF